MTLPEELALFFLIEGTAFPALFGRLALLLGETPMHGTAIFELDLALLDPRFLDFEFGQSHIRGDDCQPKGCQPRGRSGQRQALRKAQYVPVVSQTPPPPR